ncbi:TerB N-terminal domain-containing protein [Paenibacillus macerans]|uniref:TerB N-terminal domain-containing protein n=1 Tax=Paenibacillus macerans TaxID=44252 RepID=UPI00203DE18A|nr:TerB N-terminal domain-containing protein [Paenibacillus macerans]MCM3698841.1 TerB N-terminal domain-containing protein [Paenibacillus macerans]
MENRSRSIEFAEIDLYEEEPGLNIPPKKDTDLSQQSAASIPFYSRERHFAEEARKRGNELGEPAPFVPFMSYWPTYEHMMESQQKWYFYWRSEVRAGRYPDTDLSYIFVYVYELINGVGWSDPQEGYEELNRIWIAYGGRYPQLTAYLKNWLADFAFVHALDVSLLEIITRGGGSYPEALVDMELLRLFQEQPSQIPLDLLLALSDYDMRRSKFYQGPGKSDLELWVPRIVGMLDAFLCKTQGIRLIDKFHPGRERTTERYLFRSAVYDDSLYGRTAALVSVPLSSHRPLRKYITQTIRYAENQLRELRGFRGRLRGIVMDSEMGRLIDRYLKKELAPQTVSQPRIEIDAEKLAALKRDSDYVRGRLTIEDDERDEPAREASLDLEAALRSETGLPTLEPSSAEPGLPELPPSENVSPEIEITDPYEGSPAYWDMPQLDEDWASFAGQLDLAQLKALLALKSPAPASALAAVAEAYGSMPELILDEINQLAMETIGDLVVDGGQLVPEYMDFFAHLKGEFS